MALSRERHATTAVAPISARTPQRAAVTAARTFGTIPPSSSPASSSRVGVVRRERAGDGAAESTPGDVGHEQDAVGADPDRERGRRLVGVHVQRPVGERRDDRNPAGGERQLDRGRRHGSGSPTSPSSGM